MDADPLLLLCSCCFGAVRYFFLQHPFLIVQLSIHLVRSTTLVDSGFSFFATSLTKSAQDRGFDSLAA
jgi:hypothetical protein